eukprot:1161391-Pelagomonas_calceolata.AAC.6
MLSKGEKAVSSPSQTQNQTQRGAESMPSKTLASCAVKAVNSCIEVKFVKAMQHSSNMAMHCNVVS